VMGRLPKLPRMESTILTWGILLATGLICLRLARRYRSPTADDQSACAAPLRSLRRKNGAALSLEAETLARIRDVERKVHELRLDAATTDRLIQEGQETLLKSYCLQSRLQGEDGEFASKGVQ
jgi:hypothetical protein